MIREPRGAAGTLLRRLGLNLHDAREASRAFAGPTIDSVTTGTLPRHPFTERALRRAADAVRAKGNTVVGDLDLLVALSEHPRRPASALLVAMGVQPAHIRALTDGTEPERNEATATSPLSYAPPPPPPPRKRKWLWF